MLDLTKVKNPIAKGMIVENSKLNFGLVRARVRLDCKRPEKFDSIDINGECKPTDLLFYLTFFPVNSTRMQKKKFARPFILRCNMLPPKGMCRLAGYADLMNAKNPVLVWIRENTNISKATFRMALENPYLRVPFCLKYAAYAKKTGTYVMTDFRVNSPFAGSRASGRKFEKEPSPSFLRSQSDDPGRI